MAREEYTLRMRFVRRSMGLALRVAETLMRPTNSAISATCSSMAAVISKGGFLLYMVCITSPVFYHQIPHLFNHL